jgi:hypothetical protein
MGRGSAVGLLDVGFIISSVNGGASWGTATRLAGPMSLSWSPQSRRR